MTEISALLMPDGAMLRERRGWLWSAAWHDAGHLPRSAFEHSSAQPASHRAASGRLRIYLGAAMCQFLVLPTVKGIRTLGEYEVIAQHALSERLGLLASDWQWRVDPSSAIGVVICAVRHETMQHAAALASHLKRSVRSVQPWAASALGHHEIARAGSPPTAVLESEAVLLFGQDAEGSRHLRSLPPSVPLDSAFATLGVDAASVRRFELADTAPTQPLRGDFLDLLVQRPG